MNKYNFMKKIFALLFCGFCVLTIAGCQPSSLATINSSSNLTMQVVAGKSFVSQNFSFPTYAKTLLKNGHSQTDVEKYVDELESSIRTNVYNKMYLSYYAVYAAKPDNNYLVGSKQVSFCPPEYNSKLDKIEFSFNFNSYSAWNYYHPSSSEGDDEEKKDLFLNIDLSQAAFPFSQSTGSETVGEKYAGLVDGVLLNNFSQSDISDFDEITFSYDYVSTHKRLHSNADEKIENSGYYHHIWTLSRSKLNDEKTVEIKTVNAVRGWWYLVTLVSVVGVTGIGCLIILITNKARKKNIIKKGA